MTDHSSWEGPVEEPPRFDLGERLPSVFLPTPDSEVLLENERVLYRRQRHWAVLLPIAGDLVAVALLAFAIAVLPSWADFLSWLIAVPTLIYVVIRFIVSDHKTDWKTIALLTVGPVLFGLWFGFSSTTVFTGLVVAFAVRFVYRLIRWRYYFITYVTDRRLIQTNGLIIRQVMTMPIGRITDVSTRTDPLGELLGYAEFRVETAGSLPILNKIDYLAEFERFYQIVMTITTQRSERAREITPDITDDGT